MVGVALLFGGGIGASLRAQAPEAASYPVDPVAAAGMTTGLPNASPSRHAEMMQVRTSAQGAAGDAAAAMMARSADMTIEERNREAALQTARENKAIKDAMRNRLRYERVSASAAQNKVSANDMSTWQQNGGVRVERNVPNAFITSLIREEEEAAARAAASGEGRRFSLFNREEKASSDGPGFLGALSAIRPPRLPFIGGGSEAPPSAPAPQSDNSEPVFAQNTSGVSASAPAVGASRPGTVPMISGAALVDGRAPTNPSPAFADSPPSEPQRLSFSDRTPEPDKKRGGFLSMFQSADEEENSLVPTSRESSGGGGFFGFGRKKPEPSPVGKIDASLFPEGSVNQAPTGSRLSGGYTVADVASDAAVAPTSTGSIELPGQSVEPSRGFSLPKPSLSLPSLPSLPKPSGSSGGGNLSTGGYHVVSANSQFMVYGADQMQSEIRALPAGTSVLVTKPGEQWSGIRLDDGTEGVVQNKNLRPASGGGGGGGGSSGGEFATSPR